MSGTLSYSAIFQQGKSVRSLVWFRNDLRTVDHPALAAAMGRGETVACFCVSIEQWRSHDMGDRRLAFQLRALQSLAEDLATINVPLKLLDAPSFGDVPQALMQLCGSLQISDVDFIDEYPLNERRRDEAAVKILEAADIDVHRHVADVLVQPGQLLTQKGDPYTVFTPFYRRWQTLVADLEQPLEEPTPQKEPDIFADKVPNTWDGVQADLADDDWPATASHAQNLLADFLSERVQDYPEQRDIPSKPGTSGISAYLAIGQVSPRQCLHGAWAAAAGDSKRSEGVDKWLSELAWRDFYRHIVALFDHVNKGCGFRRETDHLPWRHAGEELAAWQAGETGYPLVDAAMRQLNETGWMHNRLRMVAAMFLTKHLLIDWRQGERYFMQQLVDGDFASNNGGWQWSAATGTDAAPYFRIFNPATQGQRFDADGSFTKRWVPELSDLPPKQLFEPQGAKGYPQPIVVHRAARERALAFFKANL